MNKDPASSPLAEVVRDHRINNILEAIRVGVGAHQPIVIAPKDVDYIRRGFQKGLALGERRLVDLAQRILWDFAPDRFVRIALIVWGRCLTPGHEEVVIQEVDLTKDPERLTRLSDTLLGDQESPLCPSCRLRTNTIASFVQYEPERKPGDQVRHLRTRIKTTSNICYKIADMVFDIDHMFQRDKLFNAFSQAMTDIYGIKLIIDDEVPVPKFAGYFRKMNGASVLDEKDYTGANRKKSGFEAYKVVLRLEGQLFEVQIQSENMYRVELTSREASHYTYKERQMQERARLGREYLDLYRALSGLFRSPDQNYCSIDYIQIGQTAKGMDDSF